MPEKMPIPDAQPAPAPTPMRDPKGFTDAAPQTPAWCEVAAKRRETLKGKRLLIIRGGWLAGKRFIFERLSELGVQVTLVDTCRTYNWHALVEENVLANVVEVDVDNPKDLLERCMDAIADKTDGNFHGVTTYYEEAVILAAQVAVKLDLAVNPVKAFEDARNKRRTREVMQAAGLPAPRFFKILKADDVAEACATVGFPAVIKPALGSSSFGVMPVACEQEVHAKYAELQALMDPSEDSVWKESTEVVLEEFYDGDEFDIDVVLADGMLAYAKVSDNFPCVKPWFKEVGTNCPSLFPADKQQELTDLAVDTTHALGFRNGVFHVEAKYTSRGARLLEVNARMGGYSVRDANYVAWGLDLIEEAALNACRLYALPAVPPAPLEYLAEMGLSAPYSGVMNADVGWLDHTRHDKRIYKINYWRKKGAPVTGPLDGLPSWIVEIVAVSKVSVEDALDALRELVVDLDVPITPKTADTVVKPFDFPHDGHPFDKLPKE